MLRWLKGSGVGGLEFQDPRDGKPTRGILKKKRRDYKNIVISTVIKRFGHERIVMKQRLSVFTCTHTHTHTQTFRNTNIWGRNVAPSKHV